MKAARAGGGQAIKHSAAGDDWYIETVLAGLGGRSSDVHIPSRRRTANELSNEKPTRLTTANAWMPNALTRPSANVQRPTDSGTTAWHATASPRPVP